MAALPAGSKAPDFSLPVAGQDGNKFSLQAALEKGPVLAAFFKVSCPVCQYTFPYLERIHQARSSGATVLGISQNDRRETAAFLKEYGITFLTLLDDPNGYAVSNAYGLTNVPSLFLIGQDGEIEISSVGWNKQEVEEIHRKLTAVQAAPSLPLFKSGEQVHDFRAG